MESSILFIELFKFLHELLTTNKVPIVTLHIYLHASRKDTLLSKTGRISFRSLVRNTVLCSPSSSYPDKS